MKKDKKTVMIGWRSKRLRVCLFPSTPKWYKDKRGRRRLFKCWLAVDTRSYHVAQGKDPVAALKGLLHVCAGADLVQWESEQRGEKVVRWRCLMPANEVKATEERAKKTGVILDGVEVPHFAEFFNLTKERLAEAKKKLRKAANG